MPKMILLGSWGGYFGQYRIDDAHQLSGHPHVGKAKDWVCSSTDMVFIGSSQPSFIRAQTKWFNAMWESATERSNEAGRIKRSDELWRLLCDKAKTDNEARIRRDQWLGPTRNCRHPRVGNLALPDRSCEMSGEVVDFIGCALTVYGQHHCIVVAEIRGESDSWEGAGKTKAYLSLLGLNPVVRMGRASGKGNWQDDLFDRLLNATVEWSNVKSSFRLFAADFLWASVRDRKLRISPPTGESVFGLWDVARHIVREKIGELGQWEDGFHRKLKRHQEMLFKKLPMERLATHYHRDSHVVEPTCIVLLERRDADEITREVRDPEEKHNLLTKMLRSGAFHRSSFWTRKPGHGADKVVENIVHALDQQTLPSILYVKGRTPFHSISPVIRNWVAAQEIT